MSSKEQIEETGDGLLIRAPAKVNLTLLIAGKRPDGFHEITSLMTKVNWYDELLLAPGDREGIELICTGRRWAPEGPDNLVYRACKLLDEYTSLRPRLKVTLTKNIPAGAGLGSASSDAAAALIGLDRFARLGLTSQQLSELAAQLGSDVPFFLGSALALCTGRGEKIKKIEKKFNFLAILMLPNITVSTKKVYDNYRHDPALFEKLNTQINRHLEKNRIDLAAGMCANMLDNSCLGLHKELRDFKTKIESLGVGPVCLSGSGAAMFSIVKGSDREKANRYKQILDDNTGCETVLVNNNRW